jgi:alpha/beta superfamily hydrolase
VTIVSADGLRLESEFERAVHPRSVLVVCHAHPRMHGTMNSPLLLALRDAALEDGHSVLRFNFRGVGSSEGEFGDGLDEVEDAHGALAFAREQHPRLPVAILGWSFGGAVAIRAAAEDGDVAACVGIAPSVTPKEGISVGLPPPDEVDLKSPLLIVCGSNDEIVSPADCRRWAEGANGRYIEIKAANHFFWAKYEPLVAEVRSWLTGRVVDNPR